MKVSELNPKRVADYIRVDYDAPETEMPVREDYETEEEYEAALAQWKAENADYLNLMEEVKMLMDAASANIQKRTGRPKEYVEENEDLTYPYLAMVGEMWENRQIRGEKGAYVNDFALGTVDAHAVNLIPGEAESILYGD